MPETKQAPLDDEAADALRRLGLRGVVIEAPSVDAAADSTRGALPGQPRSPEVELLKRWIRAVALGFHAPDLNDASLRYRMSQSRGQRRIAVLDEAIGAEAWSVATITSWTTALTVGPGRTIEAHAISAVTVAPTHRRHGIARTLLLEQLRFARRAGLAAAVLTASEGGIYGRYGFAPAADSARLVIDARRARLRADLGIEPDRVAFAATRPGADELAEVAGRATTRFPGEVARRAADLADHLGLADPDDEGARRTRVLRSYDAAGVCSGFAIYRASDAGDPDDLTNLEVLELLATSDAAAQGLWRALLAIDLVLRITVPVGAPSDPLRWMLVDPRALRIESTSDLLWLRLLDVPAFFGARVLAAGDALEIDVDDVDGYIDGRFRVEASSSAGARVRRLDSGATAGTDARIRLSAETLAAASIGAAGVRELAAAGRIAGDGASIAVAAERFATTQRPQLTFWF